MNTYFIKESDFNNFIDNMLLQLPVIAPVLSSESVESFFSFEFLKNHDELRLDYDITILPPKKAFFPPRQVIIEFSHGKFHGTVNAKKQVLLGVHPYDIKAIDQTDFLFTENYEDINYTAYRNATTLVCSNIQTISKRAFWGSISHDVPARGHDAFLTKLTDLNEAEEEGYLFEVFNEKGHELLSFGQFLLATELQIQQAKSINESIKDKCPQQLNYSQDEMANTICRSFNNTALWDELAQDCFSCGSCNTTCPTCYCFNVEDSWNIDQQSGQRTRYWDSCMTEDFAKISSADGQSENFRKTTAARMRHRIMRKMVYLNDKLGTQACVGCGRCSIACTADIADPVNIIKRIMEEAANDSL
ncbi:MAG: 4Fe-4S dicluster domain-containing protein [gamma proteobacterium symbiont of Taylorina sp.]|nr:4Fe-4S dicluster domain-containing protein [gamma proteobacterium symbiont of Taylorina sp.]